MKRKALYRILFISLISIEVTLFLLFFNGVLQINNPPHDIYPVRGIDVSSYQGDIDWDVISSEDISFAFIKATEGSSFVDTYFEFNYENALKTNLRVGAYHFFSFDSGGMSQAENFIRNVPVSDDMLPPVVDIEFYADKEANQPEKEQIQFQLDILLDKLEEHYGKKPILPDRRSWTFWQYTSRKVIEGYDGEEKFIDMNVFSGSDDDFLNYGG